MSKNPIGFYVDDIPAKDGTKKKGIVDVIISPRRSVVQVYFPAKGVSYAYYNDAFDLKVGDIVYVEGKLEGCRGEVVEVNYSFKIKLSDYKRVIHLVDTHVEGKLYLADSHMLAFDDEVIPYEKVRGWFMPPEQEDDEFVVGYGEDDGAFPLDDLHEMGASNDIAQCGHAYYMENKVRYLCLEGSRGRAIVEGREFYEVEFNYSMDSGMVEAVTCSCYCSGVCKHEVAVMLQLKDVLEIALEDYKPNFSGYLAAIHWPALLSVVKKPRGAVEMNS